MVLCLGRGEGQRRTMEQHQFFLPRLQGAAKDQLKEMRAIEGILQQKVTSLQIACSALGNLVQGIQGRVYQAMSYATRHKFAGLGGFSLVLFICISYVDVRDLALLQVGALFLYTLESGFYRKVNEVLRDADRSHATPLFTYLRLFIAATSKLEKTSRNVYCGVKLDLRKEYVVAAQFVGGESLLAHQS